MHWQPKDQIQRVVGDKTLSRQDRIAKVLALLKSGALFGIEYKRALAYLARCGPNAVSGVPILIDMLRKRPLNSFEAFLYIHVVKALINIGPSGIDEAISYSIGALSSRFVWARERACNVLLELAKNSKAEEHYQKRREEIGQALAKTLNDASDSVRCWSVQAYALLGHPASVAVPTLVNALRAEMAERQDWVALRNHLATLARFDATVVVPALIPLLELDIDRCGQRMDGGRRTGAECRGALVEYLGRLRSHARPALDALRRSVASTADDELRKEMEKAIRHIEKA